MVVQIVRFKSEFNNEEVLKLYKQRAPQYRKLKGLLQKYYLRYPETDEYGAVYVWDSEESLRKFRESDLGQSISKAYHIRGDSERHMGQVVMLLRDNTTNP